MRSGGGNIVDRTTRHPHRGVNESLTPESTTYMRPHPCTHASIDKKLRMNMLVNRHHQSFSSRTMSEESGELLPLGKPTSLLTKAGVRYEGKLYTVASFLLTAH
jgi:hypothetical protein